MGNGSVSFAGVLAEDPAFREALEFGSGDACFEVPEFLEAALFAGLVERRLALNERGAFLALTATSREAQALAATLAGLLPAGVEIVELPAWETLPHERLSPSVETVGQRALVFRALREREKGEAAPLIVVASVRAAVQAVSPQAVHAESFVLRVGDSVDIHDFAASLVERAYTRVDLVTRRGEFAVRGGLVDVFASSADSAVRIDFFGDEVSEFRPFSVVDQRSGDEQLSQLEVWPARELLLTAEVREQARVLAARDSPQRELLALLADGVPQPGMESLMGELQPRLYTLTELFSGPVAVFAPERVRERATSLAETNREFFEAAWSGDVPPVTAGTVSLGFDELREGSRGVCWWEFSRFADADVRVLGELAPVAAAGDGDVTGFCLARIRELLAAGERVVVCAPVAGMLERMREILAEAQVPAQRVVLASTGSAWPGGGVRDGCGGGVAAVENTVVGDAAAGDASSGEEAVSFGVLPRGVAGFALVSFGAGFMVSAAGVTVFTPGEFFGGSAGSVSRSGSYEAGRGRLARSVRNSVNPLELSPGDYVVHEVHGIGQFVQLEQREVPAGPAGSSLRVVREFVVLEYRAVRRGMPRDTLYVPSDQLDKLSRYVGGDAPRLSRMGGGEWSEVKGRARRAVRGVAAGLVKLYRERMSASGHAFSADTPWQRELEQSFSFVETADQLRAISEVKADMESPRPMDRLIAGDVGFGKTEVAVRAAFKAVQDGKQVAVLAPTTLLVGQHLETFRERFAAFPVSVRPFSRFQSAAEVRDTERGLAAGTVDVVIGTHRLFSKGVCFRDLGLVIVDEEQRFGVEHKEALKRLRLGVDFLAMSATPIPRTLEMAVTGIREMSTLQTAPEDRHPILTFVGRRDERQIAAAIRRELLREGQVFFVHNRVSSIGRVAADVARLVPEARVAVAHGRLSEGALERVVNDFWRRRFDVLVSTTIVETGLDIANANTIIVDGADAYGLSQLHQLRGRVGRSRERAYAYLLYDGDKPLSEQAYERLSTLANAGELGAGMRVALKDLELRGAGNLLGGEQSGHIAGVGFDLYLRMVGEAVSEVRGDGVGEVRDVRLEVPSGAHIPEGYIDSERLRLEAYQRFAAAAHPDAAVDAVDAVLAELRDRFGEPPEAVLLLARLTALRGRAARLGVARVSVAAGRLRVSPVVLLDSVRVRLERLFAGLQFIAAEKAVSVPLPSVSGGFARSARAASLESGVVDFVENVFSEIFKE